jgi:hypothetical protein
MEVRTVGVPVRAGFGPAVKPVEYGISRLGAVELELPKTLSL